MDILWGIMHKILSIVGNVDKEDRFNKYIKSNNSYKRSYLVEGMMKLRDKAIRRRDQLNTRKRSLEDHS